MSIEHYENFPVASILLPAHLRRAVSVIYAFARSADDLADEGDATPDQRLAALSAYVMQLERLAENRAPAAEPAGVMFVQLGQIIRIHDLPFTPFFDLLSAFMQDVHTIRYADYVAINDYCSRSANPVGRLMLHLYGAATPENLLYSDAICTALQLINFLQDVEIDWHKNQAGHRIYLPLDELRRFGLSEADIGSAIIDERWRALMTSECSRARSLMQSGAVLVHRLPGRFGWECRFVIQGGLRILEKIEAAEYDVFRRRPTLSRLDWLKLAWRAVFM